MARMSTGGCLGLPCDAIPWGLNYTVLLDSSCHLQRLAEKGRGRELGR